MHIHTPVNSTAIRSLAYDPKARTLQVRFHSGRTYEYPNVEPDEHEALQAAPSIGAHFNRHIRGSKGGKEI